MAATGKGSWQALTLQLLDAQGHTHIEDVIRAAGKPSTPSTREAVRRAFYLLEFAGRCHVKRLGTWLRGRRVWRLTAHARCLPGCVAWWHDSPTHADGIPWYDVAGRHDEWHHRFLREVSQMQRAFITPAEFARALGQSVETVRRHLRSGQIEGVHVGGSWRIPVSALARLEAAARQHAL